LPDQAAPERRGAYLGGVSQQHWHESAAKWIQRDLQERSVMEQLHQGLDYRLYKIYIWGGLPLLVIYIVVATLVFDALDLPGPQVFLVLAGPLLLWIAGIFLY
jgi:hypothetical protein